MAILTGLVTKFYDRKNATENKFSPVLTQFIDNGGDYVGISAGSILAAGIDLVNCEITGVHCQDGSPTGPIDLSTHPDIRHTYSQALLIEYHKSTIIE